MVTHATGQVRMVAVTVRASGPPTPTPPGPHNVVQISRSKLHPGPRCGIVCPHGPKESPLPKRESTSLWRNAYRLAHPGDSDGERQGKCLCWNCPSSCCHLKPVDPTHPYLSVMGTVLPTDPGPQNSPAPQPLRPNVNLQSLKTVGKSKQLLDDLDRRHLPIPKSRGHALKRGWCPISSVE